MTSWSQTLLSSFTSWDNILINVFGFSEILPLHSSSLRCPGSRGQGFELLLRRAGSHSITYLCDNITEEKPSKQPRRLTKPAASTAKCSLGAIVFQLLVATIVHVHISFFSHTYATCCTFTSVVIYCWSIGTSVCALSLSFFGDVSQFHVCK